MSNWAPVSQELQKVAHLISNPTRDIPENQAALIPGEVSTVDYTNSTVTVKLEGRTEVVGPFAYDPSLAVAPGGVMWFTRIGNALYGISYRGASWVTYNFSFTASVTNPVVSTDTNKGIYSVSDRIGYFRLSLVWNPGDTVGNGNYSFGLPPAWNVKSGTFPSGFATGTLWVIGASVDRGIGGWRIAAAGTNATIIGYQPASSTPLSNASYAWSSASPDRIEITGWVPLA